MAAPYSYSVSLRIWHPRMDPAALTKALRLTPNNSWKVGEPRRTPKGEPLKGTNRGSYWTVRLITRRYATTPRKSLDASLATIAKKLQRHRKLLLRIRRGRGKVELFVGLFAENKFNFSSSLEDRTVADLSKLRLSVALDIYP
jgi:hypothetical protein